MNSEADWVAATHQFQQNFGENWTKAMQSFSGLGASVAMPAMPAMPAIAPLRFSAGKLQALQQAYVKDPSQTIEDRIKGVVAKLRENIVVRRFVRYEIGG